MFKNHMKCKDKLKIYLCLTINETSPSQAFQVARQVVSQKVVKDSRALQVQEVEFLQPYSKIAKRKKRKSNPLFTQYPKKLKVCLLK